MTFDHFIDIASGPGDLFALTQDYARRLEWDPFLKSATLLDCATVAGVGARALCIAHSGLAMESEYVSFNSPRACAVRMTRGPRLIASFAGSWRFEEVSPGVTRVGFRYHVQSRPRWLAWLLTPVFAWVFARDTRKRLRALKDAVEKSTRLPVGRS
jgi:ribosome-associated toxin RatA of RatAB toxin-antitoxin module